MQKQSKVLKTQDTFQRSKIVELVLIIIVFFLFLWFLYDLAESDLGPLPETGSSFDITELQSYKGPFSIPADEFITDEKKYAINKDDKVKLENFSKEVSSFSLDAKINLEDESSLVRIILVDSDSREYLLVEEYLYINDSNTFSVYNKCEETCVLDSIIPKKLIFYVEDASIELQTINYVHSIDEGIRENLQEARNQYQSLQAESKLDKIQENAARYSLLGHFSSTSLSGLTYAEKKSFFQTLDREGNVVADLPRTPGFEFYKGGFVDIRKDTKDKATSSALSSANPPEYFDWRSVHGENWLSPVRWQDPVGGCWAFATAGMTEAQFNVYYNKHYDLDLSEQQIVDCEPPWGEIPELYEIPVLDENCPGDGSILSRQLRKIITYGVTDEACDVYRNERPTTFDTCNTDYVCSDWNERLWKADDFVEIFTREDSGQYLWGGGYDICYGQLPEEDCPNTLAKVSLELDEKEFKKDLIKYGPMQAIIDPWSHEAVLVGYGSYSDWKTIEYCGKPSADIPKCTQDGCENLGRCDESKVGLRYCSAGYIVECIDFGGSYGWSRTDYTCNGFLCDQSEIGTETCINDGIFVCTSDDPEPYWHRIDTCNGYCVNNECRTDNNFSNGDFRCVRNYADNHFVHQQYEEGYEETYWTFKNANSGDMFGDNGYINVLMEYEDLIEGAFLLGPFTPPSNQDYVPDDFDTSINCVDKDDDSYCNWGISAEMPATCPSHCQQRKDCNDSDATLGPYDTDYNCELNISHVSETGSNTDGDGSKENPYSTISYAISRGYLLIHISEGVYDEAIDIPEGAMIQGGWNNDFSERDPWLYRTKLTGRKWSNICREANYCTQPKRTVLVNSNSIVDGLFIEGPGDLGFSASGIYIHPNATDFQIKNCEISDINTGIGTLYSWEHQVQNGLISRNLIHSNRSGISLSYMDNVDVLHNTIAQSSKSSQFYGILVDRGNSNINVKYNIVLGYGLEGIGFRGLHGNASQYKEVEYNDIYADINYSPNIPHETDINLDPMLDGEFRLREGSPCIDATDEVIDGETMDIGAFEYTDTGTLMLPIQLNSSTINTASISIDFSPLRTDLVRTDVEVLYAEGSGDINWSDAVQITDIGTGADETVTLSNLNEGLEYSLRARAYYVGGNYEEGVLAFSTELEEVSEEENDIVEIVKSDLSERLKKDIEIIETKEVEEVTWKDTCFELGSKDEKCEKKQVSGYVIILEVEESSYKYHTDLRDKFRYVGQVGTGQGLVETFSSEDIEEQFLKTGDYIEQKFKPDKDGTLKGLKILVSSGSGNVNIEIKEGMKNIFRREQKISEQSLNNIEVSGESPVQVLKDKEYALRITVISGELIFDILDMDIEQEYPVTIWSDRKEYTEASKNLPIQMILDEDLSEKEGDSNRLWIVVIVFIVLIAILSIYIIARYIYKSRSRRS